MPDSTPEETPKLGDLALLARGFFGFVFAVVAEAISHPIVPWTYVPGFVFIVAGLGIGVGVLTRYQWLASQLVFAFGVPVVFIVTIALQTSLFPVFIFGCAYFMTRWVLSLEIDL